MSLRDDLIEAGAEAIDDRLDGVRWTTEQFAEACLDAFLGLLADRADERVEVEQGYLGPARFRLDDLSLSSVIAVLRGDT